MRTRCWPVVLLLACTSAPEGPPQPPPPPSLDARWAVTIQGVTREYSFRGEPSSRRTTSMAFEDCVPHRIMLAAGTEGSHWFSMYLSASADGQLQPSFADWSLPPEQCPQHGRCRFVASHIRTCMFRPATFTQPGARVTLELVGTCRLYRLSGGALDAFVDGDYIDLQQFRYQTVLRDYQLEIGDGGLATLDCGAH